MFSRFTEFLEKFDDDEFLFDASTPQGRKKRITKFRRARLLWFFALFFMPVVMLLISKIFPWIIHMDIGFTMFMVVFFANFLACGIGSIFFDIQIKMLLLYEKTQTE